MNVLSIFKPFTIIYFTPFYFPNGALPLKKFFIPLAKDGNNMVFAALPTSQDYIPDEHLTHGCINIPNKLLHCYVFKKDIEITRCKFSFKKNTFIYIQNILSIPESTLKSSYPNVGIDYQIKGILKNKEKKALIECLVSSGKIKQKLKRIYLVNYVSFYKKECPKKKGLTRFNV